MLMSLFSLHYTALYLSVSFVIVIVNVRLLFSPIMISFCRKRVHSLLSLTTKTNHHNHQSFVSPNPVWSKGLIGLPANVVDYSSAAARPESKDPGGIGLLDAAVDGLASCTESLGSESSDDRRSDGECQLSPPSPESGNAAGERRRRKAAERSPRRFPPPLPSLYRNGQPSFFLRPVRKDGRLELTEIRINRPEILRAHRGDGRLRLHLITDDRDMDCMQEDDEEEAQTDGQEQDRFVGGGDQGFRRCHEEVVSHHWRPQQQQQHCVTTT